MQSTPSRLRSEGPLHSYRADSIRLRDAITRRSIDACDGLLDRTQIANIWDHAKRVEDFTGPHVWTHSDLHPGNLLVRSGKLAAVIDWGSLILGDPAIDCIVAWTLLTPGGAGHRFLWPAAVSAMVTNLLRQAS